MPDTQPEPSVRGARDADERAADHAAIDRLTDELLPALVAKLSATGLGEIEVREGAWKVRLRRPADAGGHRRGGERTDRPSRAQPGHAGHGHAPAALEGHRSASRDGSGAGAGQASAGAASTNGAHAGDLAPVGPGRDASGSSSFGADGANDHRAIARSPAVGIFQARSDVRVGNRVRTGDRIGIVDMLGVPHDVLAPADGVVGASLVETGEAVEYGQELIVIELAAAGARPLDAPGGGAA